MIPEYDETGKQYGGMKGGKVTHREMVEQTSAHVEITKATPWAQVPDSSLGSLASVRDGDGLSALRTRVASAVLGRVESYDEV